MSTDQYGLADSLLRAQWHFLRFVRLFNARIPFKREKSFTTKVDMQNVKMDVNSWVQKKENVFKLPNSAEMVVHNTEYCYPEYLSFFTVVHPIIWFGERLGHRDHQWRHLSSRIYRWGRFCSKIARKFLFRQFSWRGKFICVYFARTSPYTTLISTCTNFSLYFRAYNNVPNIVLMLDKVIWRN